MRHFGIGSESASGSGTLQLTVAAHAAMATITDETLTATASTAVTMQYARLPPARAWAESGRLGSIDSGPYVVPATGCLEV